MVVFLWCGCGGVLVVVFLWRCFCGGVLVVVFLWWCTKYYSSTTKYYSVLQSTTPVLQSTTPVLLRTTKYYSSTTPYYKVLLRTTKYYSSTTKYYSSTTPYYKVLLQYYSVLQSTTPYYKVLLQYYKSITPYYKVLLQYYSNTTKYYQYYSVLQSTTPTSETTSERRPSSTTPYYASSTKASKTSISCEASATFHRKSFQNDRFVRGFLQISQNKLPKRAFRTMRPTILQEIASKMIVSCEASSKFHRTSFQNKRFARCFRQFSRKICLSLQFRAIDTPLPARGFIRQKQNVLRTTTPCIPKCDNVRFATAPCTKMYESIHREPTRFAHTKM